MSKRALTAYEDTNMYGGAHVTNSAIARKAAREGRDIIVHGRHYDGQGYYYYRKKITELRETKDGRIIGIDENEEIWEATAELCEYAQSGRI